MTVLQGYSEAGRTTAESGSRSGSSRQSLEPIVHHVLAPLAAAATFAILVAHGGRAYEAGLLAFLSFSCGAFLVRRDGRWTSLLTFMATVAKLAAPLSGALILAAVQSGTHLPGASASAIVAAFAAAAAVELVSQASVGRYLSGEPSARVAVIGSDHAATSLSRELAIARVTKYLVVGRISCGDEPEGAVGEEVAHIGDLDDLGRVVADHNIDLLVMTGEVPRLSVFDEVAASCLHLPVRLWQLASFYEEVFGHVPVAEINASWFQYIMHPKFRTSPHASKRALDLFVACTVGLLLAPLMLCLALLIRRDGGPALFRQTRIGERGVPFTVYKLRTMRVGVDNGSAQWASFDDPRVTGIGHFLRRTHLDEIPQLLNVLRGDMSIVGPRPEQPEFVERLEQWVPFYTRRHLLKPGITGWAQVRCGYAGSDVGSAWKLCHDLYYLKHRSTTLDLVILGETLRTLVADRQYAVEPSSVSFILDSDWLDAEPAPVTSS